MPATNDFIKFLRRDVRIPLAARIVASTWEAGIRFQITPTSSP
jgi:hypothetical protein